MKWDITAECVSTIILCIIWVYSHRSNQLPTLRNRMFNLCFLFTFCAMSTNILSTLAIYHYTLLPFWLTGLVTGVYFLATPLMGAVYFGYLVACLYEDEEKALRVFSYGMIPAGCYLLAVVTNPWSKALFSIDPALGYVQGPYVLCTYVIFYLYCIGCFLFSVALRQRVDPLTRRLLLAFPLLATIVVLIQQAVPTTILSGSAATCALLMLYLYLQNKQISMDYLTGLGNRGEFLKRIDLQLRKHRAAPFCLIILSLRNFRQINNKWGQRTGDAYLQVISDYLKSVVSAQSVYRFGGDEFAIVLTNPEKDDELCLLCQLGDRMSYPWQIEGGSCTIPMAVGVIRYPESAETTEELIDGAEYAIHTAKQQKQNSIYFCTPETITGIGRQRRIVEILLHSLEHDEFEVYFQPIYSVEQKRFTLAESLLRLNHTPLGPLSPGEFIPIAEDTGMIVEITYLVLKKTCAFLRRLLDANVLIDGISFNLSAIQFEQSDLVERLTEIIEESGVPFSYLRIEITESMLAENTEQVEDFINRMHLLGVRIALDDFGTGYSNLRSVMETPLDVVKFDRSLLLLAMGSQKAAAITTQMVLLLQKIGFRTLIEGVETAEQNDFAIHAGFDLIQGFWYSRPMPEQQAFEVLGRSAVPISSEIEQTFQ